MNLSQRLRTCARHTGLDAVIELLNEAADEIDRLSAGQPADITDEQIAACVKRASTYGLPFVGLLNPGGAPSEFSKRFTAEILALRPVQVPMTAKAAPTLIGWRTENLLWETDDIDKARNWEPNIGVLPIFEGDPNTKLGTNGITTQGAQEGV